MQTLTINLEQFLDLCNNTLFEATPCEIDLSLCKEVEICEDGTFSLALQGDKKYTYGDANNPAWGVNGRQDLKLLDRIIDAEFGINGMSIREILNELNDHINTIGATSIYCGYRWNDNEGLQEPFYEDNDRGGHWSWNEQDYKFRFNVLGDNECADYEGLSPYDAWEALQKIHQED